MDLFTCAPLGRMLARLIVNVPVKDVECDEIFGYLQKKEKRVRPEDDPNYGDAYTFVAIERNTKLKGST
jgi:hypothetical protein